MVVKEALCAINSKGMPKMSVNMIYLIYLETALKCQISSQQPNKLASNIEQGCFNPAQVLDSA